MERPIRLTKSDRLTGTFDADVPPHEESFVVLRAGWSSEWRATVDGRDLGAPKIADGYAAGWTLAGSSQPENLSIRFAPASLYFTLLAFAWLALLAIAALALRVTRGAYVRL